MNINSVQLIWTPDHIGQLAEEFGALLLANSSNDEREPIYNYGRHMLAAAQPSAGCIARFVAALYTLTPRMPGYAKQVAALATEPQTISLLQSNIALYVVLNDKAVR